MADQKPIAWNIEPCREPIENGSFVLGDWEVLRQIGEGAYGRVFEIGKTVYGIEKHSALKVISIPKSEQERRQLAMEMDEESVTQYLTSVVDNAVAELNVMLKLSEHPGIMRCEDFAVVQYEEDNSWDIFMRLELLESLPVYLKRKGTLPPEETARLGEEICIALAFCEGMHVMHRDVKPENIFISKSGNFKLGDFGMARIISESTMASSKRGTELYMAPEIIRGERYGGTVDTYALGLVLYRLLNDNLLPFYPKGTMTIGTREQAFISRMKGEKIPSPAHADSELSAIVLKACAFQPEDRYQSAEEMRAAIAGYRSGTQKEELYWSLSHRSMIADTPEVLAILADEWEALCFRDSAEMAKACRVRAERLVATKRIIDILTVIENCIVRIETNTDKLLTTEGTEVDWKNLKESEYYSPYLRIKNGTEADIQFSAILYIDDNQFTYNSLSVASGKMFGLFANVNICEKHLTQGSHTIKWYINNEFLASTTVTVRGNRNQPEAKSSSATAPHREIQAGDTLFFGQYEQNHENRKDPIEWQVLSVHGNKALLISRYGLDTQPYDTRIVAPSWEKCWLRNWLNSEFMHHAFSTEEQRAILETKVENGKAQEYWKKIACGAETGDMIFLLSYDEAWWYFKADSERMCLATRYAVSRNAWVSNTNTCWWWLRSLGYFHKKPACVNFDGSSGSSFVHSASTVVRPAFWVNLESEIFQSENSN